LQKRDYIESIEGPHSVKEDSKEKKEEKKNEFLVVLQIFRTSGNISRCQESSETNNSTYLTFPHPSSSFLTSFPPHCASFLKTVFST